MAGRLRWVALAPWGARHHGPKSRARPGDDDRRGDAGGEASDAGAEAAALEEEIDEAGRESFPASDPPAWTLGIEPHNEGKT